MVYALNQLPIYGTASPIARNHGLRYQGAEKGIVSLTITLIDALGKFLLSAPTIVSSVGLEVSVS